MKTILLKAAYFTIGAIVLMACGKSKSNQAFSEKSVAPHESPAPPQSIDRFGKIPNEFVCMVNNAFMGIPQIAVNVYGIHRKITGHEFDDYISEYILPLHVFKKHFQ